MRDLGVNILGEPSYNHPIILCYVLLYKYTVEVLS